MAKRNKGTNRSGDLIFNGRRERLMMLRCTVAKKGKQYIGECLELGVVSQGKTERECTRNLKEAIEAFIEAAREAKGDRIAIHPVSYYKIKKLTFDFKYGLRQMLKRNTIHFKTERRIPVGI